MADVENKEVVSEEVTSTEAVKESPLKKPVEVPETNGTVEHDDEDTNDEAPTNGDVAEEKTNGDTEEHTNGDSEESHDATTNGNTEKSTTKRKSTTGEVEEVEAPEKKSKVTEEAEEAAEEAVA